MEYMDYFISEDAQPCLPVILDAVYYVFADEAYKIAHMPFPKTYILVLTLTGQGMLQIRGKQFTLTDGDLLLFDAGANFSYRCVGSNWNFWWFEFRRGSEPFVDIPLESKMNVPLSNHHLYLCSESLGSLKIKDCRTASSLLCALLCLLQSKSRKDLAVRGGFSLFQGADQFFRRNLATATVASCARHLGISERTLRNVFHSLLDCRPVEYLQKLRLEMACHVLRTSETAVKDIAAMLGYADQFVLSKSFRKWFGVSPSQYRRMEESAWEVQKGRRGSTLDPPARGSAPDPA